MTAEKWRRPGGEPERSRDQAGEAIKDDRSTGEFDVLEAAVIELLVWGDPAGVIDAVADELLDPNKFGMRRPVVEAVIGLVSDGIPPSPTGIYERMLADGVRPRFAFDLALNEGGFTAAECRLDGLSYRAAELDRHDERRRLRMRLSELAADLDRPGGADRVSDLLERRPA